MNRSVEFFLLSYYTDPSMIGSLRARHWFEHLKVMGFCSHLISPIEYANKNPRFSVLKKFVSVRDFFKINSFLFEIQNLQFFKFFQSARLLVLSSGSERKVVISSYGPFVTILVGFILKKCDAGIYWVIDYRDDWSSNYKKQNWLRALDKYVERRLTKYADLLITVSEPYAHTIAKNILRDVQVVMNGFDGRFYGESPLGFDSGSTQCVITYTGSLNKWRPGIVEFLESFVAAANIRMDVELHIYGRIQDIDSKIFEHNSIKLMGAVDHCEMAQIQMMSDYLLFFDTGVPGELSGKIFEYMASGRPILFWEPECGDSGVRTLLSSSHALIDVPRSISDIIELVLSLKKTVRVEPSASILQFSRQSQVEHLVDLIWQH